MADTISRPADGDRGQIAPAPPADPLRLALAGGPLAVAMVGADLRYLWAFNWPGRLGAEELAGLSDEELYGTEAAPLAALKGRVLASGAPAAETIALTLGGVRRRFRLHVAPAAGGPGLLCTSTELAEQGDAEEDLRQRSAELDRREADQAAALAALARALAQAGEDQVALARAITGEVAGRLAAGCSLALLQEDGQTAAHIRFDHPDPLARAAMKAALEGASARADSWPIRHVLLEGRPLILSAEELRSDPRGPTLPLWPLIEAGQLGELVGVPLRVRGRVVGSLTLYGVGPGRRRLADDLPFLQQIADTAALALDNGRLLRAARRELAERQRVEGELRNANGRLAGLNGDLRRSRDLLRTIFDGLDDALALVGRDGRVLAINQRMAALAGRPVGELVGLPWAGCCAGEALRQIGLMAAASESDGRPRRERVRVRSGEGLRIIDAQTLPQLDEGGVIEQLVIRARDVTEQAQLEAQMIEQERFAANGRLAATVAHEVNTPLQAIISCLHMAGRVGDAERGRYLKLAREEIHRIGYIMRQLLDLYRPGGGAMSIELNALAERVLLLTGSTLSRQRVRVDRRLAADLPPTRGRTDEITQVLLNLVMNAAQAMPRGGILRIETRAEPGGESPMVAFVVADNGVGVPPEHRERIFEPFFTTREEGSGLGLAISRRIVVAHGGSIELESAPGAGSRFIVRLPAAEG